MRERRREAACALKFWLLKYLNGRLALYAGLARQFLGSLEYIRQAFQNDGARQVVASWGLFNIMREALSDCGWLHPIPSLFRGLIVLTT